jgi:hypothetical protein
MVRVPSGLLARRSGGWHAHAPCANPARCATRSAQAAYVQGCCALRGQPRVRGCASPDLPRQDGLRRCSQQRHLQDVLSVRREWDRGRGRWRTARDNDIVFFVDLGWSRHCMLPFANLTGWRNNRLVKKPSMVTVNTRTRGNDIICGPIYSESSWKCVTLSGRRLVRTSSRITVSQCCNRASENSRVDTVDGGIAKEERVNFSGTSRIIITAAQSLR